MNTREADHYFSEHPTTPLRKHRVRVELGGRTVEVSTASGVFSPERVDRGTSVLLQHAPEPVDFGDILDIGCGWGPIALDTAMRSPKATVWAVDVNERSLELCRENAAALAVHNIRVCRPDEVPAELRFTEIRSNPPIRIGKSALHGILKQWLPRLVPGGSAFLVVAKQLGAPSLQRWIETEFARDLEVDRIARSHGFHVIEAIAEGAATEPGFPA